MTERGRGEELGGRKRWTSVWCACDERASYEMSRKVAIVMYIAEFVCVCACVECWVIG